MSLLNRQLAPISSRAWKALDDEARQVLKPHLAARKLVDFVGPLGLDAAAVNTGRVEVLPVAPLPGVVAERRAVTPLVELRSHFELARAELDAIERGAADPDLAPLQDAAKRIARAEDTTVFHGYQAAGIQGIASLAFRVLSPEASVAMAYRNPEPSR